MTAQAQYQPMTASGKGLKIVGKNISDFTPQEISDLIDQYYWLVFTGKPASLNEVENTLKQFGPLTQNDRRKGVVLNIDTSKKDEGEVLLGDGFLPLHRDGALMGTNVKYVGIFCVDYKNVSEGGRTFITDAESAIEEVPQEYLDLLDEKGTEGKPVDSYYLKSSDQWHPIPGFIDIEGKKYLNVGFPSPEGEKKSWDMRIPGESEETFKKVSDVLERAVMDEKYCYYHEWTEGDLVLFDNRKTLHGREAFKGQRALANIQVLEP